MSRPRDPVTGRLLPRAHAREEGAAGGVAVLERPAAGEPEEEEEEEDEPAPPDPAPDSPEPQPVPPSPPPEQPEAAVGVLTADTLQALADYFREGWPLRWAELRLCPLEHGLAEMANVLRAGRPEA